MPRRAECNRREENDPSEYSMSRETISIFRATEYKGCGIRAASYKAGPRDWVPEACFWLQTESGMRRLWVNSFAHCLATQELTLPNKIEADAWAFRLARSLIDRTLPEFEAVTEPSTLTRNACLEKMMRLARRPLSAYNMLRDYRFRN